MSFTQHEGMLLLSETAGQSLYWLASSEDSAFRTNAYLLVSGKEAILHDPGGVLRFEQVSKMVDEIVGLDAVKAVVLSHQDPDITGSLQNWLDVRPGLDVLASPRTHVLLEGFTLKNYSRVDANQGEHYRFGESGSLLCIEAPFLHSPSAVAFLDEIGSNLLTGDIWAAIDFSRNLILNHLEAHKAALDLFHLDYMASSVACRGFIRRLEGLNIQRICPQHGAILQEEAVPAAMEYLNNLMPGLDLLYPDLF